MFGVISGNELSEGCECIVDFGATGLFDEGVVDLALGLTCSPGESAGLAAATLGL